MERRIFLLISLIALLTGCSNNESDFDTRFQEKEISFNTLRDKVIAKAANDSNNNYYVYAYITGHTNWYFDTSVDASTGETTYYWPQSGTVNFYSFCPVPTADNIVVGTTDPGTSIPITYTVPATADQDFTICTPVLNQAAILTAVPLSFNHMLSKIYVQLVLDSELSSMYTLKDTWECDLFVLYTSGTTDAITGRATSDSTGWTLPTTAPDALTTYTNDSTFIIMPQPVINTNTPLGLQITNVTIETSNGDTYFVGPLEKVEFTSENISVNDFGAGKQYNLVLTITESSHGGTGNTSIFNGKITFSSSVASWTDVPIQINQP